MILLAACTQAKHGVAPCELRLRAHRGSTAKALYRSWVHAVQAAADVKPASEVYKGGYWRSVKNLRDNLAARVLIASAGLGLISEQQTIPTYSATFVAGTPDSIPSAATAQGRRSWWGLLGGDEALRRLDLGEQVIVVLPSTYLRLIAPDLNALVERYGTDRLVVFGPADGTASRNSSLARAWVPTEARMAWKLGANVAALAPAVAAHCLARMEGALDHDRMRRIADDLVLGSQGPVYPKRQRQSPEAVRAWIREQLHGHEPPPSASAALRCFRNAGLAYEQHAFHHEFHKVVANPGINDA